MNKKLIILALATSVFATGCSISTSSITCTNTSKKDMGTTDNTYTIKFKDDKMSGLDYESTVELSTDYYNNEDIYSYQFNYLYQQVESIYSTISDEAYQFNIKKVGTDKINYSIKLDVEKARDETINMLFQKYNLTKDSTKEDVKLAYENLGFTCQE